MKRWNFVRTPLAAVLAVGLTALAPAAAAGEHPAGGLPPAPALEALERAAEAFREHTDVAFAAAPAGEVGGACRATGLQRWSAEATADWTGLDRAVLGAAAATMLPAYEVMYGLHPALGSPQEPVLPGARPAPEHQRIWRKLAGFWGAEPGGTALLSLDGSMLTDPERTSRVYRDVFGMRAADADALAEYVAAYVDQERFDHGDHPAFTNVTFAHRFSDEIAAGTGRRSVVAVGEGSAAALRDLGHEHAVDVLLAHEYAHLVGWRMDGSVRGDVRGDELAADALSAYFLSHPHGMAWQWQKLRGRFTVYGELGDCAAGAPWHHGTPAQREAAAMWGYRQQEASRPRSLVLAPQQVVAEFLAKP
ncbi:hypothetical protein GMA12_15645 [Kocuria sediminis]|uniref:Uncharacterized protein n=1 Tax=Kocuria sediminis TaxID=1038857 RepID=A0A6N8GNT3_9MICC|nr:hypothetical protein [Kocuria sediminis]MUN64558.1 hypothetical protein [Kocuria sediminis]